MNLWTDATCMDCLATAVAAQWVRVVVIDGVPQPPELQSDGLLRDAARFIFARDIVARLEAFSPYDFSGAQLPAAGLKPYSAHGHQPALVHEAFEVLREAGDYDLDAHLFALINGEKYIEVEGTEQLVTTPDAWLSVDLYSATALVPRRVHSVIRPYMDRAPSGQYSPAGARHSAVLLNQLRSVRHTANVAVDAGLATTAAASWTAARAALLAQAQAAYPARGYT